MASELLFSKPSWCLRGDLKEEVEVMFWFLEREQEVLICEIRHAENGAAFELSITGSGIPERIERFDQPVHLIERWLRCQQELRSMGWLPRH